MGQLVKIGFSYHTLVVRLGSMPYVHRVTMGAMSDHNTVHLLCRFSGRTSFSLHYLPILRLLRPTQIITSMQSNNTELNKTLA